MKYICLFLSCIFCMILTPAVTQSPEQNEPLDVSSYLKDLEELGYCVIPRLFSEEETRTLYERVWHEFIEKAWPLCQMHDRSNWRQTFPIHTIYGIFAGPAGQTQVMWDLRQDPRIVDVFAKLWNTPELIVSMDSMSIMCPPEIREHAFDPWPHVDQVGCNIPPADFISESLLKSEPYTVQGQFLFEESCEGDGGFYCIPKSHLRFSEIRSEVEAIHSMPGGRNKRSTIYLEDFFKTHTDFDGNPYVAKHVTAPRGSLILWDSRTVHWNQMPSPNRPFSKLPKVRMVGYLCYAPKARLEDEGKTLRKKAFETGVSTTHNPVLPKLNSTPDFMQSKYQQYMEDPSYVQPEIKLTPLGQGLVY